MASASTTCRVQSVSKASSDELLRKFADSEPAKASPRKTQLMRARRKRPPSRRAARPQARDGIHGGEAGAERLAEWKALLQHAPSRRSALLRQIGMQPGRSELGPRQIAGVGILLTALEKTWRKTVEGASRILVEKRCNRHVRLISDAV